MSQLRLKLQGSDPSQAFSTRGIFSSGYLLRHLRAESEHFVSEADAEHTYNFIRELWLGNHVAMRKRGEAFTCSKFIEPVLERIGWALIPQEAMPAKFATRKRPDYCLFLSEEEQREAAREDSTQDLFRRSATVFEAKAAEHPLDRVSQRETPGWFPSQQVQDYLRHARDASGRRFFDWAILSNGNQWRLYTEHAAPDAYFEFELASDGELCAVEEFRIFLTLFRPQAFQRREDGRCFLDDVRDQSLRFQADLETNLRRRIFDVLEDLATAYAGFESNRITEARYGELYSTSLIFLYRLLFILYAESRGLLPVKPSGAGANRRYRDHYSLARLVERLRDKAQFDSNAFTDLYEQLLKLFDLINGTHPKQNEECGVTQYNGGLFKPEAHPLIQEWRVGDRALADVLRQLIFAQPPARRSQRQQQLSTDEAIDYSTLEVRQLGDIYEGLLGAHLEIDGDRLALKNEKGENQRQGIYYTPDWVVCFLVRETLAPLIKRIEQTEAVQHALAARSDEKKRDNSFAHAVLQLNIVDPAMGSGHFLVRAVELLAREIVRHPTTRRMTAQVIAQGERRRSRDEIAKAGLIPVAPGLSQERAEIAYWRRRIVEACIYGVDLNPLAVELTKLSLWLTCVAVDEPLNFLDHHLRTGNSLLFARPDEINRLPFSAEHFPLGTRPAELLAAAISETLQIEVSASTEMQVIEEKENLWRKVRDKLQSFWTVGDLWLAVLNGMALNDLDYQTWAKSLLDPESLTADESQHAKKLMRSLHGDFERMRAEFTPFHWHFEFPDVFFADDGEPLASDEAGFDAVLGNPPYISTHTSSEEVWRSALERRSGFLEDLYVHFTELGFHILRRNGRFGFIVSDTFFTLASKLRMRETLQTNTLTHLGQCDPFEATVDAAIFVAEKNEPSPEHKILFVQARPRRNGHGQSTKPEKDLPELPCLDAIEWNSGTTFVESIGATIRHGNFRSLRLHLMPSTLFLGAQKSAFFEPRPQTLALFDRYNDKVKALVDEWWDKIED